MIRTPAADPSRVLVIDDDPAVRQVVASTLTSLGVTPCIAAGGREGVARYASHAALAEPFDLVVLDVRMPEFDGPATLAALRAADPGVRCCFMSGDTGGYTRPELHGMGADWFLAKPFRWWEMAAVLAAAGCGPPAAAAGFLEVLVIDGGEDAADSLADVLRLHGHTVTTARTGSAGLRSAADHPHDAVVYDLDLPDMNGASLSGGLRHRFTDRRSLLVAIGRNTTGVPRAADVGADLVLVKPVEPDVLTRLLGRFARLIGPAV